MEKLLFRQKRPGMRTLFILSNLYSIKLELLLEYLDVQYKLQLNYNSLKSQIEPQNYRPRPLQNFDVTTNLDLSCDDSNTS